MKIGEYNRVLWVLSLIIWIIFFTACGEEKNICFGYDPIVSLLTPNKGGLNGGDKVTIKGVNFCPDPEVRFGENIAPKVEYISRTEITVITPPSIETGPVDVTIINADGKSGRLSSGFTYS